MKRVLVLFVVFLSYQLAHGQEIGPHDLFDNADVDKCIEYVEENRLLFYTLIQISETSPTLTLSKVEFPVTYIRQENTGVFPIQKDKVDGNVFINFLKKEYPVAFLTSTSGQPAEVEFEGLLPGVPYMFAYDVKANKVVCYCEYQDDNFEDPFCKSVRRSRLKKLVNE